MDILDPTILPPPKTFIQQYKVTIAACVASGCSITTGYPLDSVKTRMQALNIPSTLQCIQITNQQEGFKGFFRGMQPILVTGVALRTLAFNLCNYFQQHIFTKSVPGHTFYSGMATGAILSVIGSPIVC